MGCFPLRGVPEHSSPCHFLVGQGTHCGPLNFRCVCFVSFFVGWNDGHDQPPPAPERCSSAFCLLTSCQHTYPFVCVWSTVALDWDPDIFFLTLQPCLSGLLAAVGPQPKRLWQAVLQCRPTGFGSKLLITVMWQFDAHSQIVSVSFVPFACLDCSNGCARGLVKPLVLALRLSRA